jgi:LmbE family N-acetylglucosaminyl deacetylase
MSQKVLVVAVHPDDETLGCGGTLLKHKANNDEIHWLICTQVPYTHSYHKTREKEIEIVKDMYGFDSVHSLGLDTMHVDEHRVIDLISKISKVINEIKPSIIYLPFKSDVHTDHKKIFEACYSCTKSFRYPFIKKIYMMEVVSETEFAPATKEEAFVPNVYVDITEYIDKKVEIMSQYKSEMAEAPFPRSEDNIRALSIFRGCSCGVKNAESFMLLKEIL